MDQKEPSFVLFNNCKVVKGAHRGAIYDLERRDIHFAPNGLCDILIEYNKSTISHVKKDFDPSQWNVIDEYFRFLTKHDIIMFVDQAIVNNFTDMSGSFITPRVISNCLIEAGINTNWEVILSELEKVGCQNLQVRLIEELEIADLDNLKNIWNNSHITSIQLVAKNAAVVTAEYWQNFLSEQKRINYLVVYEAQDYQSFSHETTGARVIYSKLNYKELLVSTVDFQNFSVNISSFLEAQKANLFYNKKLVINATGNIVKNLDNSKSYGVLGQCDLNEVFTTTDYMSFWKIGKDLIEGCRNCEMRYCCFDPREPMFENSANNYRYSSGCICLSKQAQS
ncbi:SPASM domain peptide maturase, grasp-with-spasm system [Mucilaginibacter sp. OK268]|uniref:hypothetical protein n=1 Tax=Mucilaginibacter sp. OK268 TaxID=1881048 RepID=UPI00087EFD62|nr:hypothetical protein [Mucilaginibacter sp. OK268]SDP99157.1 SPASM domain peptide maturase, grasp-with-spasm system [Mucilaginibacter sp. OK268]